MYTSDAIYSSYISRKIRFTYKRGELLSKIKGRSLLPLLLPKKLPKEPYVSIKRALYSIFCALCFDQKSPVHSHLQNWYQKKTKLENWYQKKLVSTTIWLAPLPLLLPKYFPVEPYGFSKRALCVHQKSPIDTHLRRNWYQS